MIALLRSRWTLLLARLLVGGVFIYAGVTKVANPLSFADSIATFQILPPATINLLAISLPIFEIIIGLMLVTEWRYRTAALCAMGLSIVFGFAIGQAIVRGIPIDCGCFGSGEPSIAKSWLALARDMLLLAVSGYLYAFAIKSKSVIEFSNEELELEIAKEND